MGFSTYEELKAYRREWSRRYYSNPINAKLKSLRQMRKIAQLKGDQNKVDEYNRRIEELKKLKEEEKKQKKEQ